MARSLKLKLPAPWKGLGLEIDDAIRVQWAEPGLWPPCVEVLFTAADGTPFVHPVEGVPPFPLGDEDLILEIVKAR